MSTFYSNIPPPPPVGNGGFPTSVIVILVILGLKVVVVLILCWASRLKRDFGAHITPANSSSTGNIYMTTQLTTQRLREDPYWDTPGSIRVTTLNVVQVWTIEAPTMERFHQDLAKERPARFTDQQLSSFTNNYSKVLGSGGFGIVYEGRFRPGAKIAVKVLKRSLLDKRAKAQFKTEVSTIGRTYHKNLVRLYGFSYNDSMSALVYEYMENGSLDKHLFNDDTQGIDWKKLPQIAIGTARGIAYLHEECQHRIIHYDIKPGNVLLDANFIPKVADFGLAKICNRDSTHDSPTGYRGTPGYSAPEFLLNNYPITYKCDVYSFGMLLFEIVGRRKNGRVGSNDSLDWFPKLVWDEYEKDELATMTLSHGIEDTDREIAQRMAIVALWCVQDAPETRPPMSAVVKMLEGGVEIMPPPKPFHYLFSLGVNAPNPRTCNSLDNSSGCGTNSYWYKEEKQQSWLSMR